MQLKCPEKLDWTNACVMCLTYVQEGELRPQLLDRFGMSVSVTTLLDVDVRTQMVLDKMAYEQVRLPCMADHHQLIC